MPSPAIADIRHSLEFDQLAREARARGLHPRTLRRRVADGSLPAYRFGPRLIYVRKSDVDALFERIPTAGGAR